VKADGRGLGMLLGQTRVETESFGERGVTAVTIGGERWIARHWRESGRLHVALAFPTLPSLISWCDLRREVII